MQLINDWYYFENVLSHDTCDILLNLSNDEWKSGIIDNNTEITDTERIEGTTRNWKEKKDLRTSDVKWVSGDNLNIAIDILVPYMVSANDRAGWKFNVNEMQNCQLTRYNEGAFYTWHRDGGSCHLFNSGNRVRKLSMTVCLNDEYEGGELQFCSYGRTEHTVGIPPQGKGTIIVFPSFLDHQVAPVTKGIRYSCVVWFTGPPFI
jgi:PKHD-type hydroxylase